jgi:hypothetical protein
MSQQQPRSLEERLHALAAFLPRLEQADFEFGNSVQPPSKEPDVFIMPFYSFSSDADAFIDMTYEMEWVLFDFDWPSWMSTAEATTLRDDPDALARATPDQLARLLTVLIRQERFSEGSLASAFESGLLTGIVRRAAQLEAEMAGERA